MKARRETKFVGYIVYTCNEISVVIRQEKEPVSLGNYFGASFPVEFLIFVL